MVDENPIGGVEIIIEVNELKSGSFSSGYTELGRVFTDDNGYFSFTTDPFHAIDFRFTLVKDGYHTRSFLITPNDIVGEYTINEEIGIESYLKIRVKNNNPENENDVLKYRIKDVHEKCDVCCNGNFHYFNGTNIDTIITCPITGLNTVQLEHVVIRDSDSEHFMQGIYCTPNDTVEINILY
jgi:hypothetical protein